MPTKVKAKDDTHPHLAAWHPLSLHRGFSQGSSSGGVGSEQSCRGAEGSSQSWAGPPPSHPAQQSGSGWMEATGPRPIYRVKGTGLQAARGFPLET